jgi:hypothetical protein
MKTMRSELMRTEGDWRSGRGTRQPDPVGQVAES